MMPSSQPPQPTGTEMYCLPSRDQVDGLLWCPLPHWKLQSFSPVSACSAMNSPVGVPANTTLPAVLRVEAAIGMSSR